MDQKPWLKHYPEEIPHEIRNSQELIHDFLSETAREFPDKKALHFLGKEFTFRYIYEAAEKMAGYLQDLGIKKGDRVAIMLPNTPQAVISFYGVLMAGGVVVLTNPLYTERELQYQMTDSGAKVIITLDILFPRVTKIREQTDLRHIIVTAIKDFLPFPKNIFYPFIQKKQYGLVVNVTHEGIHHLFTEILKGPKTAIIDYRLNNEVDLALLQYTGGTTGKPKGVMLTHKNLVSNVIMCDTWLYKYNRGEESILGIIPFFHVYGLTTLLILAVMQAYKMVLLPKFDPKTALKTIHKQKPTIFPGAPTLYIGLLNHPDIKKYDLSSIDSCISGSAPLPQEVQKKFEEVTGGKLVEGYGLTEASPVTHGNFLWDRPQVKGSVGVPWPSTDAVILSLENGEVLPPGEKGEIAIRGSANYEGVLESTP